MFDWLGESPAAGLQWLDITLSFIAFGIAIVALQTIIQMFWGRAKLEIEFERYIKDAERGLIIHLKNPPVKSKWGKRLGLKRDSIQSLAATTRIYEGGSGKIIDPVRQMRIHPDDDPSGSGFSRVTLPPHLQRRSRYLGRFVERRKEDGNDRARQHTGCVAAGVGILSPRHHISG